MKTRISLVSLVHMRSCRPLQMCILHSIQNLCLKSTTIQFFGLCFKEDPLVRKRCLYLVQKAVQLSNDAREKVFVNKSSPVFWWNPDNTDALQKIWHQYVFLLEILEEKQVLYSCKDFKLITFTVRIRFMCTH